MTTDRLQDSFLTVAEVAERLRLCEQTVRNMIDRGELAAIRVGPRRIRVREAELDRFLAAGATAPVSKQGSGRRRMRNTDRLEIRRRSLRRLRQAMLATASCRPRWLSCGRP